MRIATYTRVSTTDQAKEGYSLDAQLKRLESYCQAQENYVIVKRYSDDGETGRDINRKGYQLMIEEREQWDSILVLKMDRIHRNSRNFMDMMDMLKKWKKGFASATENLDTSTAMGEFVVDIIQRIAQLESDVIGERIFMGMKEKAETTTGILGRPPSLGYDFIPSTLKGVEGTYAINEPEATTVRRIYRQYLTGKSMRLIAEELRADGVPTKRNKTWESSQVGVVLSSPFYCGWDSWDGKLRRGNHPAIITIEEYNRVQRRIGEKRKRKDKTPKFIIEGMN